MIINRGYTDQRSDGDTESRRRRQPRRPAPRVTQTNDPMGILKDESVIGPLGERVVTQTNDPMGILKVEYLWRRAELFIVTQTNDPMGILKDVSLPR